MQIRVLSAEKTIYTGNAQQIRFPGIDGSFTVLNNHAPMVAKIKKGDIIITLENSNNKEKVQVSGGLVRVMDNEILVLLGT